MPYTLKLELEEVWTLRLLDQEPNLPLELWLDKEWKSEELKMLLPFPLIVPEEEAVEEVEDFEPISF